MIICQRELRLWRPLLRKHKITRIIFIDKFKVFKLKYLSSL